MTHRLTASNYAMPELTFDQAKRIYRAAIDSAARDDEGKEWWESVACEMREVCGATSVKAAATVIDWWHNDWSCVGDSATSAAQRIRAAAKSI